MGDKPRTHNNAGEVVEAAVKATKELKEEREKGKDVPFYPCIITEGPREDWSRHFPPTAGGIESAVLAWKPIQRYNYLEGMNEPWPVFHEARVEECQPGSFSCWVTALIDPELAAEIKETVGWEISEITDLLSYYLEEFRPVGILWHIQILVQGPYDKGPYR
jgi:hypothetical protein